MKIACSSFKAAMWQNPLPTRRKTQTLFLTSWTMMKKTKYGPRVRHCATHLKIRDVYQCFSSIYSTHIHLTITTSVWNNFLLMILISAKISGSSNTMLTNLVPPRTTKNRVDSGVSDSCCLKRDCSQYGSDVLCCGADYNLSQFG